MSHHDEDPSPDEAGLQALFDATAEEPTPEQLNRMARAAAKIPETAPRPWWQVYRRYLPALAIGVAAATAYVLWHDAGPEKGPTPVALDTTSSPTTSEQAPETAPDEEATELLAVLDDLDMTDPEADDEFDISLAAADSDVLDDFDLLLMPDDDGDLDALTAALDEVVF